MGYNISDVGGEAINGVDQWEATLDLSSSSATTVSGDFDVVSIINGNNLGDATDGYVFSGLSDPSLATLTFDTTTGEYTFTVDWTAVIATGSDQVVSFTVTGTSGGNSDTDTVSVNLLICVVRGTRIETRKGQVKVEDLAVGDMVRTLDGAYQPIRWVGSRKVTRAELKADKSLRPVRIKAGTMGDGMPRRDLRVSPQHRLLLNDWRAQLLFGEEQVLVAAKSLTNDSSIRVDTQDQPVEYFHVLFDDHQIMFTEGLATESFHPGRYVMDALSRAVREELLALFPNLECDTGYGKLARLSLKPWEANVLLNSAAPGGS